MENGFSSTLKSFDFWGSFESPKNFKKAATWRTASLLSKFRLLYKTRFFYFHHFPSATGAILSGQYNFWNIGLTAGLGTFVLATTLAATCFFCLGNSLAEIMSIMPFSGMLTLT